MAWRNVYLPHASVVTPVLDASTWVESLTLWQAEGAHQVAEFVINQPLNSAFPSQSWRTPAGVLLAEQTPVQLSYGWYADDSATFYGYVASSRVMGQETDQSYGYATVIRVAYTCVGVTLPMQSRRNRLWRDVSASSIARTIALSYNLQPVVDLTNDHFIQLTQVSSDWQMLVDLSERVGYRLWCDGTMLWFTQRLTVLPAQDQSIPRMWETKQPGVVNSLRSFAGTRGDTDPAGGLRATYTTAGYSTTSGVVTEATYAQPRTDSQGNAVQPLITAQFTDRPAGGYTQARTLLAGAATTLWAEARAVTNGDPRLRPGSLIDLEGDAIAPEHTGLWMVRSAIHRLTLNHASAQRSEYTSELVLGRNDAASLDLPTQGRPPVSTGVVLVNDVWRAAASGVS